MTVGVVLLVRHGQATLGSANYDQLSDRGRAQARLTGARLAGADTRIARVVCGALVRQRDTALAVLGEAGLDPAGLVTDPRLDEYDHIGVLAAHTSEITFEGAGTPEAHAAVQPALEEAIARWRAGGSDGYVESHQAFVDRALTVVDELGREPGTSVLATSGGVIAVVTAHLLGLGAEQWPALARVTVNGSITKLISGRAGLTLVTFNDHAHLEHDRSMITYR